MHTTAKARQFVQAAIALVFHLAAAASSLSVGAEEAGPEQLAYKQTEDAKGNPVTLHLHVFKPAGWSADDKRPAVVFFFGGGWVGGSPTQFYPQSRELAARGIVAMSAEYRIKGKHGTTPLACVEDGKSAVRFIRANADKLGIDPDRIVAGGGSAGGHVAACTGVIKGYDAPGEDQSVSSVPNLMLLFNPVIDTAPKTGYGSKKVPGDDPLIISPVHHVAKGQPPALILQGDADTTTPIASSRLFVKRCNVLGIGSKIVEYQGAGHGFFNDGGWRELKPGKPDYHAMTMKQVTAFLEGHGYLKPADGAGE